MSRRRFPLASLGCLLVGLLAIAPSARAQAAPSAPTAGSNTHLRLSTDTTDVQTPFVIAGTGFTPSSTVILTVADDNEPFGSALTNSFGAFNATVQLPANVPFGMQPISAVAKGGDPVQEQVLVQYGGWPPLDLAIVGKSGPLPGQVTFTVSGRNLSDYILQTVRVRVPIPSGATFVSADQGGAMVDGEVGWDNSGPLRRGPLSPRSVTFKVDGPVATHAWAYFYHSGTGDGEDVAPPFQSSAATPDVTATP